MKVLKTFSSQKNQKSKIRPEVQYIELIEKNGILGDKFSKDSIGDKFCQSDEKKTVLLVGIDSYNIAKENSIALEYGALGENILVDFNPNNYNLGDKFIINEDSIIEITSLCTVCSSLSKFDKKLPKLLSDKRGVYCKIVKSGRIKSGNLVKIIT